MQPTHYEVLGATPDATPGQLRQAFRQAALRCHPDKAGADASRDYSAVQRAWEVSQRARPCEAELACGIPLQRARVQCSASSLRHLKVVPRRR